MLPAVSLWHICPPTARAARHFCLQTPLSERCPNPRPRSANPRRNPRGPNPPICSLPRYCWSNREDLPRRPPLLILRLPSILHSSPQNFLEARGAMSGETNAELTRDNGTGVGHLW